MTEALSALAPQPEAEPVRKTATKHMVDAAFNALPPDAHGTIGTGEMYRVIEAALRAQDLRALAPQPDADE